MMEKRCNRCGEVRDINRFPKNRRMKDGRLNQCNSCRDKFSRGTKEQRRKHSSDWKRKNKEKNDAHQKIYEAIRSGEIERPKYCEDCGSFAFVEAHHFDYSLPFEVKWLCRQCHVNEHSGD